jgi:hypothetical protein
VELYRAITRDESIYPDPDTFDPERFYSRKEMDPREIAFGFGRRSCPGMHLAVQGFFIAVTSFLWSYHIRPRQDPSTMERDIYKLFDFSTLQYVLEPSTRFHLIKPCISRPLPFEGDIKPRSALTEQRLREVVVSGRPT